MTRGKPIPVGPVVRLPKGVASWEELARAEPRGDPPPRPVPARLPAALASPAHGRPPALPGRCGSSVHPEHQRFDVDFDIPDAYLPEFPPPLFLTTRPDLGDVSRGHEITQANFRELFDGILTPEQMEGLRLLVTKFPTTWFNQTKHRVTEQPVRGTACFDCHVNGHTNGAIALDPATRPTLLRTRVDTPSLRGNHNNATVQLAAVDPRDRPFRRGRGVFRRRYQPPAPARRPAARRAEHEPDGRLQLDHRLAPGAEAGPVRPADRDEGDAGGTARRGPLLRQGPLRRVPPGADLHRQPDARPPRRGVLPRPRQGWIKTFSLRGIKDSPPYLHDGRLPTLEDTVEFFNLLFGLKLDEQEKHDLTRLPAGAVSLRGDLGPDHEPGSARLGW